MRALLLAGYGDRPPTSVAERPDKALGPDEVRVRVEAAALNPLDAKIATGAMKDWFPVLFPYVPGTDFAGVVEAVGIAVDDLAVGDPVFGRADPVEGGAIADWIVLGASQVAPRPLGVSPREAACLPTPAGVALQVLERMPRDDGEPILVLGDGLVAHMATELAGGAARRIAESEALAGAGKFRFAVDTVGGSLLEAAWHNLSPGAHLVTLTAPADPAKAAAAGVKAEFAVLETSRRRLQAVGMAVADGVLVPRIDHVFAFDNAATAFDRYVARDLPGKIVIGGAAR